MDLPSHKETLALLDTINKAAVKKAELLRVNKEAARALLASISTVSYVKEVKKESNELVN